ncbi:TIGR02186 family protein [Paracoccus indicus]|uniref:TIGR02186 family protein n=1 Tax=Paracoccus indicus TaxID=2079229 RepID=UPI000D35641A|nr:TIGR02186 family protein [Paracoccus indicus]
MTRHPWIAALFVTLLLPTAVAAQSRGSLVPPDETTVDYPLFPNPGRPRSAIPENQSSPAEQVVAGLSDNSVAITTSFDGSEILIYGAVRREVPIPDGELDVIVTIEAPSQPMTIWRKQRRFGIWVNTERVEVGAAPSYYAVASTGPLDQILLPGWDSRYRISLPQALRAFEGAPDVADAPAFTQAMVRLRQADGHFRLDEGGIELAEDTLFRADIRLPANLLEGDYKTRIFLLRDGQVIDVHRAAIEVRKVGLERWLYNLAFDQPLIYGLMSLAVAVFAGWGASAAFRKLRRA